MYNPKVLHAIGLNSPGDSRLERTSVNVGAVDEVDLRYSRHASGVARVHSVSVHGRLILTSEFTKLGGMLKDRFRSLQKE